MSIGGTEGQMVFVMIRPSQKDENPIEALIAQEKQELIEEPVAFPFGLAFWSPRLVRQRIPRNTL
jgi:hypothetical protein